MARMMGGRQKIIVPKSAAANTEGMPRCVLYMPLGHAQDFATGG